MCKKRVRSSTAAVAGRQDWWVPLSLLKHWTHKLVPYIIRFLMHYAQGPLTYTDTKKRASPSEDVYVN